MSCRIFSYEVKTFEGQEYLHIQKAEVYRGDGTDAEDRCPCLYGQMKGRMTSSMMKITKFGGSSVANASR